ncbi:MAG: CoB--CoM heterodisulfide reductase iron-sulfur subunit A family protein [Dehalococcoidia bacterium]|nr:CoB--CoM heterodisulfide reductase iron-sulfur subunit A family protein [Dehalococcoidia bacterium]
MARIGVFVCHCGTNIAGVVSIPAVLEAAKKMPGVVVAADDKYSCSDPGQSHIRAVIEQNKLNRVVIGSCSPRMHEFTFRKVMVKAGLNPYFLEVANIREQVSWVHSNDKEKATAKAIDHVRIAVAKVARDEALFPKKVPLTKRALVIGGGITGMQAALDIANAGHPVTLVERESSIGGHMAQLDKTFPTLDCSACILTPKMVEIVQHPNITLLTYSEVRQVSGFVGNFDVEIVKKARKVDAKKCTGCGICWLKCPEKVSAEFNEGLGERKAIYVPFPQAVPLVPKVDLENCLYIKYQNYVEGKSEGKRPMQCRICEKLCPVQALAWDQQDEIVKEKFGAIVVATGYKTFDPSVCGEYGGGKLPDVISGLQLERMFNSSGPTGGEVLRPSDGAHPKTVVLVSCVGSRDEQRGRPYCSKICCMYTAKQTILLKEHDPEVQCYVFYIDIRTGGKDYEEFARRAQEEYGALYLRGRVSRIYEDGKQLVVLGEDSLMGRPVEIRADMVVLATGVEANEGAAELAQTMKLSHDVYDFLTEAHPKLKPVETQTDGILVAGACVGPKDIPECVAQGGAAAAKVSALFSQEMLTSDPMVASVDNARCIGCLLCVQVCPYKAIDTQVLRNGRTVALVNESLCRACGLCPAVCRPKAVNLRGFTNQQLLAEVNALWQ